MASFIFYLLVLCAPLLTYSWHQAKSDKNLIDEDGFGKKMQEPTDEDDMVLVKKQKKLDKVLKKDLSNPLNHQDFRRAKLLTAEDFKPTIANESTLNNPKFFEGDIDEPNINTDRNAIRDKRKKWPNGRIPYVISSKYSERERAIIARAFQEYHEKTCIRFEPKNQSDHNYIYISPRDGCSSPVGMNGGQQMVSLGPGCVYVGIAEHELMHSIGFWHEQSRADRDQFIRINWQNIKPGMEYNFQKYTLRSIQHLDENYDYSSIMHYGAFAFARNRHPTITPLKKGAEIGQRNSLSRTDLAKINKLYECKKFLSGNHAN